MDAGDALPAISRWRTITWGWLTGFILLLLGISLFLAWADATRKLDRLLHDSWVRLSQWEPPSDIVIVAIDPDSLAELGRWPWPRRLQTRLYNALADAGVRAAVIDILYVEPAADPADDQAMAAAIARLPASVLPVLTEQRTGRGESLPVPTVSRVASGLGHIFLSIDDDGIVRRVFLKSGFRQAHWSALGLEAQAILLSQAVEQGVADSRRQLRSLNARALPGRRIAPAPPGDCRFGVFSDARCEAGSESSAGEPGSAASNQYAVGWVQDHEVMIPFAGGSGRFQQLSAADIIADRVPANSLRDKVAFVGLTSTGLNDVVPTPVSALFRPMPGIEIHANVFAGLREGVLVTPLSRYAAVLLALLLLPGMVWWYSRTAPQWALFGALAAALLPILLSFLVYRWLYLWFAPLVATVPVLLSYLAWSWHRLDFVNRFLERESRTLAPHLAVLDNDSDQALGGFFHHAVQHLPIREWSVLSAGQFQGSGERLVVSGTGTPVGQWQRHGSIYRRRYDTPDALQVRLDIPDTGLAGEILRFVDSLPRIRVHQQPSRLSGSIERLQGNVLKLAAQTSALRGVKIFTETVMAGSPAGSAVWNAAGESVQQNGLLLDLVSRVRPGASLRDFLEAVGRHPGRGADAEQLKALLLDGAPWQMTYHDERKELVINLRAVGATLEERLVCATVIDVSQIRTVERSRAEMLDYLAHDLRSPLVSALYLLDDEDSQIDAVFDDPAMRERRGQVGQRIRQSLKMMDDLLHVARADSLDATTFREVYLNGVIDAAIDEFDPQARALDIALVLDMPDVDVWLTGDANLLERAVKNVIGNALKFSDAGSKVTVQIRPEAAHVDVVVIDQGIGIAPEMLAQLFRRFSRDEDENRVTRGFGLGLALVAQVVQQHRGEVWATSSPLGSRITLRIPRTD